MADRGRMFRFLHSADLHLGKPYGSMPADLRGRLQEARHTVLERLAARAREGGAATILIAGDLFDTGTPSPQVLRQALAAMAGCQDMRWFVLPGNHDSLASDALWESARKVVPQNVELITKSEPLELAPGVVLLPAPCTTRRPGRDLTEWMTGAASPDGAIRIGLAHGPVQSFSEDGAASDVIAPDRAARAGLGYLALGDWHGPMRIGPRTWYSGTPEPDRFKHEAPGQALLVSIAAADAEPVETGSFRWMTLPLECLPRDDLAERLAALLPAGTARRQALMRIVASGRVRPASRVALEAAIASAAPEFAMLEIDAQNLLTECESDDLDEIDRGGALRKAAEALLAESSDTARAAGEREIAREALMRLYSYCAATAA